MDSNSEPFSTLEVTLSRHTSGFGFRIIGGREEGSQVCCVLGELGCMCEKLHW